MLLTDNLLELLQIVYALFTAIQLLPIMIDVKISIPNTVLPYEASKYCSETMFAIEKGELAICILWLDWK